MLLKKGSYLIPKVALFSIIATILSFIKIPLIFIPNFYSLEFSDTITLIGSFYLGPLCGILILLFKNILLLFLKGTQSLIIGEIANFILGTFFILPCSTIYKNNRTFKGAIFGMFLGIFLEGLASVFLNLFVFLPVYSKFLFVNIDSLVKISNILNPLIKDKVTFVILAILPFNLLKFSCISLFVVIIYKKISRFIDNIFR